jgi:hypothetical protein
MKGRLVNSFANGEWHVYALRQPYQTPILVSSARFDYHDSEIIISGEYQLNLVFSGGFKVVIAFENFHYILTPGVQHRRFN